MIKGMVIALFLLSGSVFAKEDPSCIVMNSGGGPDVIACPNYVITKDKSGATICRVVDGTPQVFCKKIE